MDEPTNNENPVPREEDSNISMLCRDLYALKEPEELIKRSEELFTPKQPVVLHEEMVESQPELVDAMTGKMKRRKSALKWILVAAAGVFIFVLAIALTLWYRSTQQVNESQVGVEITAPSNFIAGGLMKYTVTVRNNSHVNWGTVNVLFTPSSGFVYKTSTPMSEGSIKD